MAELYGSWVTQKIDAKGRVFLSSVFRKEMPNIDKGFVIKYSDLHEGEDDRYLELIPIQDWERKKDAYSKLYSTDSVEGRSKLRRIFRGARRVEIDKAGRLLIPSDLREWAHLKEDIVMTSLIDTIEIWDAELYNRLLDKEEGSLQEENSVQQTQITTKDEE